MHTISYRVLSGQSLIHKDLNFRKNKNLNRQMQAEFRNKTHLLPKSQPSPSSAIFLFSRVFLQESKNRECGSKLNN